ncbi:hypothetical protein [Lacinutrix sp.]|uniref:hypothetical protein n=1 Tax=Lacinutrix sp. TaxID=1937692 RepID=UPI0025C29559|nr:hypothetical protein [Lacinutrix sp.]
MIAKEKAEIAIKNISEKLNRYTFLKLDDFVKNAVIQYLSYFSSFVSESRKTSIKLNIEEVDEGINISFDSSDDIDELTLKDWFDDYIDFLYNKDEVITIDTDKSVTSDESDIIILKLKNQINNFNRQIDIAKVENSFLKDEVKYLRNVTNLLSAKSNQFFISSTNQDSVSNNQNYYSNGSQFIGNTINDAINISNVDERLLTLISDFSRNEKEKNQLYESFNKVKDNTTNEKEKKKSGSYIKKFLESVSSETAKELISYITENASGWMKYIDFI